MQRPAIGPYNCVQYLSPMIPISSGMCGLSAAMDMTATAVTNAEEQTYMVENGIGIAGPTECLLGEKFGQI